MSRAPLKPMIIALLETGASDSEIAKAVGCARSYANNLRVEIGMRRQAPRRRNPGASATVDWEAVARLASDGWGQIRLARHFGVAQHTISRGMRMRGIVPAYPDHHSRKRAGEVSPAGPSIPDTPHKHSAPISETELSSLHSSQVTP